MKSGTSGIARTLKRRRGKKIATIQLRLPVYWASALINGDESGLDVQDINQIDAMTNEMLASYEMFHAVDVGEADFCSHHDGMRWGALAGDCATYTFHVGAMKKGRFKKGDLVLARSGHSPISDPWSGDTLTVVGFDGPSLVKVRRGREVRAFHASNLTLLGSGKKGSAKVPDDELPINFEGMSDSDLSQFISRYTGSSDELTRMLTKFAYQLREARQYRLAGRIQDATRVENFLDGLYKQLPAKARW